MAVIHNTVLPNIGAPCGQEELSVLKGMYKEMYVQRAPLLAVNSLQVETSDEDEFYHETRSEDRDYDPFQVHVFGPLDQYMQEMLFFGLDEKRSLTMFTMCVPELEDLSLAVKTGDVIVYDGQDHEILTVKRLEDAYFAHTNYCFELVFATYIPNVGS